MYRKARRENNNIKKKKKKGKGATISPDATKILRISASPKSWGTQICAPKTGVILDFRPPRDREFPEFGPAGDGSADVAVVICDITYASFVLNEKLRSRAVEKRSPVISFFSDDKKTYPRLFLTPNHNSNQKKEKVKKKKNKPKSNKEK